MKAVKYGTKKGLSPHGESGLKSSIARVGLLVYAVSLRMERVD